MYFAMGPRREITLLWLIALSLLNYSRIDEVRQLLDVLNIISVILFVNSDVLGALVI